MEQKRSVLLGMLVILFVISLIVYKYIRSDYLIEPEIQLLGDKEIRINVNEDFKDPGFKATINGKDANDLVKTSGVIDIKKVGNYKLKYTISNYKGKKTKTITRIVMVVDTVKPTIELTNGNEISVEVGSDYNDPGYKALDNLDGDISNNVKISGEVNTKKMGTYELTYTVLDSSKNETSIKRIVHVVDTTAPGIYLEGKNPLYLNLNDQYNEPGFSAIDNNDGNITKKVVVNNNVVTSVAGVYKVSYSIYDSSRNYNVKNRIVYVGTQEQINANTYIAISIAEQYMYFYKNGSVVLSSPIVTGTNGVNDTPRGNYKILGKARNIYLTGPDYRSYVSYWMPFIGNKIGLHDASWRGSFGGSIYLTNGSHGCVNMPYYAAQALYEQAPVGTTVKVY